MIKTVKGNIFDFVKPNDAIVHGCNAQGVMGSGIALEVKQRYPGAFNAYVNHHLVHGLTLGDAIPYFDPKDKFWIINAVTQEFFGRDGKRYVSYDAVADAFKRIRDANQHFDRLLFPLIGAGLGGGDWTVIQSIIESEFKGSNTELILVEFQK
jgi:O-acetyl-ADP-ribose deacetylase (regulator of RNase III)